MQCVPKICTRGACTVWDRKLVLIICAECAVSKMCMMYRSATALSRRRPCLSNSICISQLYPLGIFCYPRSRSSPSRPCCSGSCPPGTRRSGRRACVCRVVASRAVVSCRTVSCCFVQSFHPFRRFLPSPLRRSERYRHVHGPYFSHGGNVWKADP